MMNSLKCSIVFLFMISLSVHAQESKLHKDDSLYLDSNGSIVQYDYAYDQLLQMMEKQYPKSEKNKEGWQYLKVNKDNAIAKRIQFEIAVFSTRLFI